MTVWGHLVEHRFYYVFRYLSLSWIIHDRNPLFPGTLAVTKDLALQVVSGAGGVVDR